MGDPLDVPEPLERAAPGVPADVTGIVMQSLEKDPACRPQSVRALLDVLERGISLTSGPSAAPAQSTGAVAHATGTRDQRSIAVLPFANLSTDPEAEFFSDGMTEEILNALAKVKGLKVAGRTSAFSFKGKNEDLRTVGKTLAVAHVLEGSVRKQGDKVRITAQLIQAEDGYHLWSESYDGDLKDVFELQERIAARWRSALAAAPKG